MRDLGYEKLEKWFGQIMSTKIYRLMSPECKQSIMLLMGASCGKVGRR